jgi:hypothetical protein
LPKAKGGLRQAQPSRGVVVRRPITREVIGPRRLSRIGEYLWKKRVTAAIVMDFVMFTAYHE